MSIRQPANNLNAHRTTQELYTASSLGCDSQGLITEIEAIAIATIS